MKRFTHVKFTFAPYGGFDGWDIYRTRRTNRDSYTINGSKGQEVSLAVILK